MSRAIPSWVLRPQNAQVAVYLVYASDAGHALIDRELYVPRGWIDDPDRCRAAGIPAQVRFRRRHHDRWVERPGGRGADACVTSSRAICHSDGVNAHRHDPDCPLTDVPSKPPDIAWSTVPTASSGKPAQLTGGGVRLRLPGGWHGRTTSEGGLLTLQAANFSLATHDRGQDPFQAMSRGQVEVTLSTEAGCCPAPPVSASPVIGASDFLHGGRVPVGRAFAVKSVRTHGSILYIEALFGARPPAASLLRQTNQLLASLTVT